MGTNSTIIGFEQLVDYSLSYQSKAGTEFQKVNSQVFLPVKKAHDFNLVRS